jgi:hypothetical protein
MFIRGLKEKLVSDSEALTKQAGWYHANKVEIGRVAVGLSKIDVHNAVICGQCVDLSVTGDKHTLNAIFSAFRKLGYEPTDRPGDKPASSFSCHWEHSTEDARFWLYFSSNKCTRIKVGTETKEVPIYEIVCE